jgi:DDE family transposase
VSPRSLAAAFSPVPDPRRPARVAYALPAILTLAIAALLANHLSVLASAEWGARQTPEMLRTLGFPDGRTPAQSTVQRLFRALDGHALSLALSPALCAGGHRRP